MDSDITAVWTVLGVAAVIIILIAIAVSAASAKAKKERKKRIYAKYGQTEIAQKIIECIVWTGESSSQLRDSLGDPVDIDQKVLKTKKKEVWKYKQTGVNRFSLKITLDDDIVVGWDKK